MKSYEARRLSDKASVVQAKKYAIKERLERSEARATKTKAIRYVIDSIESQIENVAKSGNYWLEERVTSEGVAERVANHFRNKGFHCDILSDTVFTGVDEWEDYYKVKVGWYK